MTDQNLIFVDFITHSEILIDAKPADIWPLIVDPSSWHATMDMVPVDGPAGEVGQRFHAVPKGYPDAVAFHVVNAEVEPDRRRTMRLESTEGAFMGFSSWTLSERGAQTALSYDVYTHYAVPAEHLEALRAGQGKMDEGLVRLKDVIESQTAG